MVNIELLVDNLMTPVLYGDNDILEEYTKRLIILEKWYDMMKQVCLEHEKTVTAIVPAGENRSGEAVITGELLVEALDFCREG